MLGWSQGRIWVVKESGDGGGESSVVEDQVLEDGNGRKICVEAEDGQLLKKDSAPWSK